MNDPVDYQTPLPAGLNLRWHQLPDGARISRDVVSRAALWREAILPPLTILLLLSWFFYSARWLIIQGLIGTVQMWAYLFGTVAAPLALAYIIRDCWQNSGVVTEIAISSDTFFWKKQNLWGSTEYFWPLASVRTAKVDPVNRVLKVFRLRGPSLSAFAFHRLDELNRAAEQINRAIETFHPPRSSS